MRILIAEDSVLLLAGLERLLVDAGHEVVATASDASDLLELVAKHEPDLAIVDVRMPPTFTDEGIRAAVLIRHQHPDVSIVVLSQYVEERYAADLIADNNGGFGYLLKDRVADVEDFLSSIEVIGSGGTVLDPEVVSQILVRGRRRRGMSEVTAREKDVLQLMAEGRSNAAIAKELYISPGSVEKHVSSVFTKFDLTIEDSTNRRVLAVLRFLQSEG